VISKKLIKTTNVAK